MRTLLRLNALIHVQSPSPLRWTAAAAACLLFAACGASAGSASDAGTVTDVANAQGADVGQQGGDAGVSDGGSDGSSVDSTTGSADTWGNYAQGFFVTYCTSCHTVGASGDPTVGTALDFTHYGQVQAHGASIQCGVAVTQDPSWSCASFPPARQFPICNSGCTNPKPSNAERTRLSAWITAGMPQ